MLRQNLIAGGFLLATLVSFAFVGMVCVWAHQFMIENENENRTSFKIEIDPVGASYTDQELHAIQRFLNLDHAEMIEGKDSIEKLFAGDSEGDREVAKLTTFEDMTEASWTGFVSNRLSVAPDPEVPNIFVVKFDGLENEDSKIIRDKLVEIHSDALASASEALPATVDFRFEKLGAGSGSTPENTKGFWNSSLGLPCGALAGIAIGILGWTFLNPFRSTLNEAGSSLTHVLATTMMLSVIGAFAGYFSEAQHPAWESTRTIQLTSKYGSPPMSPKASALAKEVESKLNWRVPRPETHVGAVVLTRDDIDNWKSFRYLKEQAKDWRFFKNPLGEERDQSLLSIEENHRFKDSLVDHLKRSLVVEVDKLDPSIVNLRLRCRNRDDASLFLTLLIMDFEEALDLQEEYLAEKRSQDSMFVRPLYSVQRLGAPAEERKVWPAIDSDPVKCGTVWGAMGALVFLTVCRVLVGRSPL